MKYYVEYTFFDDYGESKCKTGPFKNFFEADNFVNELRNEKYVSGQCPNYNITIIKEKE